SLAQDEPSEPAFALARGDLGELAHVEPDAVALGAGIGRHAVLLDDLQGGAAAGTVGDAGGRRLRVPGPPLLDLALRQLGEVAVLFRLLLLAQLVPEVILLIRHRGSRYGRSPSYAAGAPTRTRCSAGRPRAP